MSLRKLSHRGEAAGAEGVQVGPAHVERLRVGQDGRGEVLAQLVVRRGEPLARRRVLGQRGEEPLRIVAERDRVVVRLGPGPSEQVSGEHVSRGLIHGGHRAARDHLLQALVDEVHHRQRSLEVGLRGEQIAERTAPAGDAAAAERWRRTVALGPLARCRLRQRPELVQVLHGPQRRQPERRDAVCQRAVVDGPERIRRAASPAARRPLPSPESAPRRSTPRCR